MKNFGFTLIEIVIVLAILTVLLAIGATTFKNFNDKSALEASVEMIVSVLHGARSKALASEDASRFGVHFAEDRIVLFRGASYVDGDPSNKATVLPSKVAISSINLGGPVDVIFSRLTGTASVTGTVVISLKSDVSKNRTITIIASGLVY